MLLQITLAFALIGVVVPNNTHSVPLKDIWALKMGGTKDIRKLDPPKKPNDDTAISKIHRILIRRNPRIEKAGPCFLVTGEGKQALFNAVKIMEGKTPIPKTMPAGKPLTLFFYSQKAPGYVLLQSAERTDSGLTLNYQVVRHQSADVSVHFALVPLGTLPEGKFKVDIKELEPPTPYANQALADRSVCDPCEFVIKKEEVP